jgi:putative addiction module component (TIGR02574 family)
MEKQHIELLQKLTLAEKFDMIQFLWSEIASENEKLDIPEDHKNILRQRLDRIERGEATFKSWEEIRSKYIQA